MKMIFRGLIVAVFALTVTTAFAQEADSAVITRTTAPDASAVQMTEVVGGFSRPLYVTHAGDGSNRLFVVEQGGRIYVVQADGTRLDTPFLNISDLVSAEANQAGYTERGLLGLAFHPNYAENGTFFINYTDRQGDTQVARAIVSADDPNVADAGSLETILTSQQPYANHNGGHMAFGADSFLYIALGDGGSAGDPQGNGQDLSTLLGKILRINVDDDTYAIPPDNPFVGVDGAQPEIWAYGVRNPWRFSFDRATGDLYMGDVGQNQWEEINFQAADEGGGANYGWKPYEGTHPYSGDPAPADMVLPIAEYDHSQGISVTAGYVYRGETLPDLQGAFFYGDFGTGTIWTAWRNDAMEWQSEVFIPTSGHTISSFGEDETGELYLVDYNGGIFRFDPA